MAQAARSSVDVGDVDMVRSFRRSGSKAPDQGPEECLTMSMRELDDSQTSLILQVGCAWVVLYVPLLQLPRLVVVRGQECLQTHRKVQHEQTHSKAIMCLPPFCAQACMFPGVTDCLWVV